MSGPAGEMPFLDHLEELRTRLIRALLALVAGFAAGLWIVQRFELVVLLKTPIAPYLESTGGKLAVLSPTEPVMIVLKLGFIVGLVLASPVVIYQLWAFLSPALYERERRTVLPALFVGLVLFLVGAALGYLFVVPQALRVLFSFQSDALALVITYNEYFGFVLQIVLALGVSFELPLVIVLLAALGVLTPASLNRFRRFAIVLACVGGALLSPGTDVISMIMMTLPLLLLYEVGFLGAVVVHRRRRRREAAAAAVLLLLALAARPARAQEPVPAPPTAGVSGDSLRDTTRARAGQPVDTATARRLGLPTGPAHSFAPTDSLLDALLALPGFEVTRYRADSATLLADQRKILLDGEAMTQRRGTILEADSITYQESTCVLRAAGSPHLFDGASVLVGEGIRYDTCLRRGVVEDALTNFQQGSTVWFLRGDLAQDSSASRLYAASSEITSCNLPVPHYHFQAREVKWISKNVMVARPAVLYVRDVPILWLPFVFQDARPGRRSGILIPQFGLNDLVRPNTGYNRQITNLGYYWAPSDYFDLTARLDWFANRSVQYGISGQYRWLNRFVSGALTYKRDRQSSGTTGTSIQWDHRQSFDLSTSLNFDLNYVSSRSITLQNAIDPQSSTQLISSSANFTKRYRWGTVTLGGNRRQSLSDNSASQTLPALTISPKPFDLSQNVTWSPALSLTNVQTLNAPQAALLVARANGSVDTVRLTADSRTTALNLDTPLRFGGFSWRNSVRVTDQQNGGRNSIQFNVPDSSPGALPGDSVTVTRTSVGTFSTGIDWDTGINLPTLFRGSWKLQPVLGIANTTSGPFLLRNQNTNGSYVRQGKRFSLVLSASPTFFGFFPGFGPVSRIRHSFSPTISYTYNPAAQVPADFARALAGPGQPLVLRSDPTQTLSIGLSQNFEGKARPAPGDTSSAAAPNLRKFRLLSIATGQLSYDFEQAKNPGRTGWRTQTLSNAFQSDLLPGFNLSFTHDLWRGPVGFKSTHFDPFLQSVSASFAISGNTFRSLASLVGLGHARSGPAPRDGAPPPSYVADPGRRGIRPGSFYNSDQASLQAGGGRFTANFTYSLSRSRPDTTAATPRVPAQQNLGFSTSFSPTPFWTASWSAQYNITGSQFESQVVRLERNLHEWRAGFNFVRNANGNFAFYFSVYLTDLPAVKFDYNQATFKQ